MLRKVSILLLVLLMFGLSACFVAFDPLDHMHDPYRNTMDQRITSGPHFGTARGFKGDITVALSLRDGIIENVRVHAPHETRTWTNVSELIRAAPEIIEVTNSPAIDGFSSATGTRNGIREAGRRALEAAGAVNFAF